MVVAHGALCVSRRLGAASPSPPTTNALERLSEAMVCRCRSRQLMYETRQLMYEKAGCEVEVEYHNSSTTQDLAHITTQAQLKTSGTYHNSRRLAHITTKAQMAGLRPPAFSAPRSSRAQMAGPRPPAFSSPRSSSFVSAIVS